MTKAESALMRLQEAENSISDVAELLAAANCHDLQREAMEFMAKIQARELWLSSIVDVSAHA